MAIAISSGTNTITYRTILREARDAARTTSSGCCDWWERFAVFTMVAFVVFVSVLRLALRKRVPPAWASILMTALFVVFGGMLFARWTYAPGVPWWIFYGVPALATFLMPPMVFRMSRVETGSYMAMAVVMAPAIHVFFSFFVGWHDYMPWFYVRSFWELLRGTPRSRLH